MVTVGLKQLRATSSHAGCNLSAVSWSRARLRNFILLKRRSFVSNRVGRSSGRYWSGVVEFSFKPDQSSDRNQELDETCCLIPFASENASIPADSVEMAFDDVAFSVTVILPESNRSQRGSGHYQRLYEPITRIVIPSSWMTRPQMENGIWGVYICNIIAGLSAVKEVFSTAGVLSNSLSVLDMRDIPRLPRGVRLSEAHGPRWF